MSKIFSAALLVSCATAQLTTSAWIPGAGDSGVQYAASVVNVENDRTTLSLDIKGLSDEVSDLVDSMAQTITVGGNTYYAYNGAVVEAGVTVSVTGECSRKNTDEESASCSISTSGFAEAMSSACSEAGASEEMCDSEALKPTTSMVLPGGYFSVAEIVVTAGSDKLPSASAAATPSVGSASPTASPSASDASESTKPTASSSGASKTPEASPQSTNAAPMMTMAPALAGLGAAAAAFFL